MEYSVYIISYSKMENTENIPERKQALLSDFQQRNDVDLASDDIIVRPHDSLLGIFIRR